MGIIGIIKQSHTNICKSADITIKFTIFSILFALTLLENYMQFSIIRTIWHSAQGENIIAKLTNLTASMQTNPEAYLNMGSQFGAFAKFASIIELGAILFCVGYSFQYLHNLIKNPKADMPDFDNSVKLILISLQYIVGAIALMLICGLVFVIIGLLSVILPPIGILLIVVFSFVFMWCLPAVMLSFSQNLNVSSVFNLKNIYQIAISGSYCKAVIAIGLIDILSIILCISISAMSLFVAPILIFSAGIIMAYVQLMTINLLSTVKYKKEEQWEQ